MKSPLMDSLLHPLLTFLDGNAPVSECDYRGWRIIPVSQGRNNRLSRATSDIHDTAVKFMIRDERGRAQREYRALQVLHDADLAIAPAPLYYRPDTSALPVVVQEWCEGLVTSGPPECDSDWHLLVEHYASVHSVTEANCDEPLSDAIANKGTLPSALAYIDELIPPIPLSARPAHLERLLHDVRESVLPGWNPPPRSLCRVDPNPLNLIRLPAAWKSVDWEYAGWGDPAADLAEVIAFPEFLGVTEDCWSRFIDAYADRVQDREIADRIRKYRILVTMQWLLRFARIVARADRKDRMWEEPEGWQELMAARYAHYLQAIEQLL